MEVKNRITNALAKAFDKDGFTHFLMGKKARFIVGLTHNKASQKIEELCEKLEAQASFFENKFDTLTVGGWMDITGEVFIDIGTACDNFFDAIYLAKQYSQIAIWDNLEKKEIRL